MRFGRRSVKVIVAGLALIATAYRFLAPEPTIEEIIPGAWRIDLTSRRHLDHFKEESSADVFRGLRKIFASNHTFVGIGFPKGEHQGIWAKEEGDGIVVRRSDTGRTTIWHRIDDTRLREDLPDGTIDWVKEPAPSEEDWIKIRDR